jgi:hypothetical protein
VVTGLPALTSLLPEQYRGTGNKAAVGLGGLNNGVKWSTAIVSTTTNNNEGQFKRSLDEKNKVHKEMLGS